MGILPIDLLLQLLIKNASHKFLIGGKSLRPMGRTLA
jgi:hypothetical protein